MSDTLTLLFKRDPLDQACALTDVSLLIYSDTLTPKKIGEVLGITATVSAAKGEPVRSGAHTNAPQNNWFLESRGSVSSKDMRDHLDWLLARLEGHEKQLQSLKQMGVSMYVKCIWFAAGSGGPILQPDQMESLGKMGLQLSFSFADYSDDE